MQVSTEPSTATDLPLQPSATYYPETEFYGPVHKGLRYVLSSLLTRLGTCAWDDAEGVAKALDDLEGVLYMFAGHAAHEDTYVQVALEARRAGSTVSTGRGHERQERMIAELRALSTAFAGAQRGAQRGLWRTIYLRYAEFAGENLMHMSEEELVQQPLLEALYTKEEIADIHRRLMSAIGPEEKFRVLRVMFLGATAAERVALLENIKHAMPRPALGALLKAVQPGLEAPEFEALTQRLA
jgi:hypothetical protein